jgi:hypothetical protein
MNWFLIAVIFTGRSLGGWPPCSHDRKRDGHCLHDLIANTIVVRGNP